jgi:FlgD Ig-like domain
MGTKSLLAVVMLLPEIFMLSHLRAQYIDGFSIIPSKPTPLESVTIVVSGGLASTGVHLIGSNIVGLGNGFEISLYTVADSGVSLPILLPYSRIFIIGILEPGNYFVRARSYFQYQPFDLADTSFVVGEPLLVEQGSRDFVKVRGTILNQNHPNPFNPTTAITYQLPAPSQVQLTIYNTLGQKVRTLVNDRQNAGNYSVQWDGRNDSGIAMASGVYLYQLRAGEFVQTKKLILMK